MSFTLTIPAFELVAWSAGTLLVLRILNGASPRWWQWVNRQRGRIRAGVLGAWSLSLLPMALLSLLRAGVLGAWSLSLLPMALLSLPVFALERTHAAIDRLLGGVVPAKALTHDMHDEFGWGKMALTVRGVIDLLPVEEREATTIAVRANHWRSYGPV
jgi:hypothetical protein